MKRFFLLFLFTWGVLSSAYGQVLWTESFAGETDGATTGLAGGTPGGSWSASYGGGGLFSKQSLFGFEFFFGQSMGGTEGRWATNVIDISSYGYAIIDVTAYSLFTEADGDYFEAYYILNNNGIEVPFYTQTGSLVETGGSAIVAGSQLQVVVRMMNDDFLDTWGIQDVTVTGITTLFSTNLGGTSDWNNGSTWSTAGLGGAVAGIVPNNLTRVVVGNGYSIAIPVESSAIFLEVQSGGSVTWSAAVDLNIGRGGISIQSGGSISSGVSTTAQIDFDGDVATPIDVEGSLTIGDIEVNGQATITITGTGAINVVDQILFNGTDASIVNNSTLTAGSLLFDNDFNSFVNNATTTFSGNISCNNFDDDNTVENALGATLSFVAIDGNSTTVGGTGNGGNLIINNSGTINQSGNFFDLDNGSNSDFNNLSTGNWYWSLTPTAGFDGNMTSILDCSAVGNTFHYSAFGFQNIIGVTYQNLTISGSNSKQPTVALNIDGDLTIQDANLGSNSQTINIAGDWQILGTGTFTEGLQTVIFDGAGAQNINNSNDNTFYNLTLNKSAAANTVTMNNALTVSNTLTLTTGGLIMNGNVLNITRNATGALAAAANGYLVSESEAAAVVWNTRAVTGTFTFPFRNAAGGTAIAVTFNKTTAGIESGTGAFAVSTYGTGAANTPYPSGVLHTKDASGVDISANVADRFWVITPSGYSTVPDATVTFRVTNAERPTGNPNLQAQRWNSVASLWDPPLTQTPNSQTSAQVAIPGTFSAWALSDSSTPLPIELLSFEAQQSGNAVKVNWSTATELNNDFFTLERLNDADGFDVVLTHPGKGTTTEVSHYEVFDRSPRVGKNYYRLKQTDFNGQFSYSDIVLVEFAAVGELLQVYPNPTHRKPLNLEVRALAPYQSVPVVIHTALGTEAFRATAQADGQGYLHLEVPTTDWPTGLYLVQVGTEAARQLKVIIE